MLDLPAMEDVVGWSSSFVLMLTIGSQVVKQLREKNSAGVSHWLYVGQIAASLGFTVYSALLHNLVFVVTNSLLLVSAVVGLVVTIRHESREKQALGTLCPAAAGR